MMMWLFSLFLLVLGSSETVSGSNYLVETLKCSRLRPKFPTHRDLFVSPTQMDDMCRQQDQFFKCLDNIVASEEASEVDLPSTLQNSKKLFKELCSSNSAWQREYLEMAPCINGQQVDFCTDEKFLVKLIGSQDACSIREKAVNCITATLSMMCGMDAGNVFLHLLKMATNGENCYMVGSDILYLPELQESTNDDSSMDSYNKPLVSIIAQELNMSEDYSVPDATEEFPEDDVVCRRDYPKHISLNTSSKPDSKLLDACIASRLGLHETTSPDEFEGNETDELPESPGSVLRFHGKNSISRYIRSSPSNIGEFAFCENTIEDGKKMYICTAVIRKKSPICLEGGRTYNLRGIYPDDIDPELGAKLYITFPYAYHFRPYEVMYKSIFKRIHKINKRYNRFNEFIRASATSDTVQDMDSVTEIIGDFDIKQDGELGDDSLVTDAIDSTNRDPEMNDGKKKRSIDAALIGFVLGETAQRDSKPITLGEVIASYFMPATASRNGRRRRSMEDFPKLDESSTVTSVPYKYSFKLSKEHKTLYEIYREEMKWMSNHFSKSSAVHSERLSANTIRNKYYAKEGSRFVNMTCGRVNECHPNATGIHKCLYYFSVDDEVELKAHLRPSVRVGEPGIATRSEEHDQIFLMEAELGPRTFSFDTLERSEDVPKEQSQSENAEYILELDTLPLQKSERTIETKAADLSMDERDGEVTFEYKPRFETSGKIQQLLTSLDKLKKLLDNTMYVIGED